MKTSTIKLVAVLTALSLVSANVALAKNGNNGGNNGGKNGNNGNNASKNSNNGNNAVRLLLGGGGNGNGNKGNGNGNNGNKNNNLNNGNGNGNGGCNNNGNNGNGNNGGNNNGNCNNGGLGQGNDNFDNFGQAFEPFHSNYVVLPGDSFFVVSLKEYGTSQNARSIALFNNLPPSAPLTPGQIIQLPSISVNGRLSPSRAPIADALQATQNGGVANFTNSGVSSFGSSLSNGFGGLVSNATSTPVVEAPRPKVTVGSTLLVDGQSFGPTQGAARLKVAGANLKIEVVEWKADSVKIRLPNLDLENTMKADIEVVRADGSLASRTPVELGAASVVATR